MKLRKEYIILFLILIIAFIFRFWRLSQLQYFNIDEELEAFFSQRIFIEKRPVLIGGGFPGGFYTGPLFRYFASIIYALWGFDPVGPAVAASLLGVVSVGLIFWVGKLFAGRRIGLLAAYFYSLSYLIVIYNRTLWPISWAPVVTLLSYLAFYKIAVEKKLKYMFVLGAAFAMGINSDPSTFSLIILAFFVLRVIKNIRSRRILIPFISLIMIAIIPVVLFDLRHDFLNVKKAITLFSGQGAVQTSASIQKPTGPFVIIPQLGQTFSRIVSISGSWDVVKQILPCDLLMKQRQNIIPFIYWGSYIILGFFLYKTIRKRSFGLSILSGHLLIIIVGIIIYNILQPGYTHEWFLSVFFPSFCLILAYTVIWLYKHPYLKVSVFFLTFIFTLMQTVFLFRGTNSAGMALKKKAVQYAISEVGNEPFYLDVLSSCYAYGGYRYLFRFYQKEPVTSFMDYVYSGWLYKPYTGPAPQKGVVFMPFTEPIEKAAIPRYEYYKKRAIKQTKFDDIEVLIVNTPYL